MLCISGDVFDLSKEQRALTKKGIDFYKKASPVIVHGLTRRFGPFQESNRDLKDYQAGVRYGEDGSVLVIVHSFAHDGVQEVELVLDGDYVITDQYETGDHAITITGHMLHMQFADDFDAVAVLLSPV